MLVNIPAPWSIWDMELTSKNENPKCHSRMGPNQWIFFWGGVTPYSIWWQPFSAQGNYLFDNPIRWNIFSHVQVLPLAQIKGVMALRKATISCHVQQVFFPSSNRATKYCNHMCWSPNPRFAHVMWYERHRWRPVGLHHIKPCFWMHIISPYIALTIGLIYGRCLNFRYLKWAALPTSSASLF
jgi:hypothetical protein